MAALRRMAALLLCLFALSSAAPGISAQEADDDGWRVGVSLGGIGLIGLTLEYYEGSRSVELGLATWAFRDISVSAVGKQYVGRGDLRPYIGAGLWTVVAWQEEGIGKALLFRGPVGVDGRVSDEHFLAFDLNIDRALWIDRADPEDETPPSERFVPLPGIYYRWSTDPF